MRELEAEEKKYWQTMNFHFIYNFFSSSFLLYRISLKQKIKMKSKRKLRRRENIEIKKDYVE
jgi:hypothetical protein